MMLKTDEQNRQESSAAAIGSSTSPPEDARVSVEEFIAAINRIDARRSHDLAHDAETVSIGQTLRDLRIDATAEEVIREIEQMRVEPAAGADAAVAMDATEIVAADQAAVKNAKRLRRLRIAIGAFAAFLSFMAGTLVTTRTTVSGPVNQTYESSNLENMQVLASGQEIFLTVDGLQKLFAVGVDGESQIVGATSSNGDYKWPVVDRNGRLYACAYVDAAEVAKHKSTMTLWNITDFGETSGLKVVDVPIGRTAVIGRTTNGNGWDGIEVMIDSDGNGTASGE
jgi:hypothetical protein